VVADARLPVISGLELQPLLAKAGVHLPVIITSGYGEVHEAVRAMKAGALDYLEKPFIAGSLLDRIHDALAHAAATAGSSSVSRAAAPGRASAEAPAQAEDRAVPAVGEGLTFLPPACLPEAAGKS